MAPAAAAAKVRIPRGRLVFFAVSVTLLLVASWVGLAFHIAEAVDGCLAVGGSAWAHDGCRHMMTYPPTVAAVSLVLMLSLCRWEAQAEAKVREAEDGAQDAIFVPELGFAVGMESRYLLQSDAMAMVAMVGIYMYSFLVMVLGLVIRCAGSSRLAQDQADEKGQTMMKSGTAITNVGCVSFWIECCCLVIPYVMLRLRRFVRVNWAGALPLDAHIT
ncbi:hypothetical protein ACP70R_046271 [Stipagrostis hirtigluma subsp. patula]